MKLKNKKILILIFYLLLLAIVFSMESYLDNYLDSPNPRREQCRKIDCSCFQLFFNPKVNCPNELANKCFEEGICKVQNNGFCGFTYTKTLRTCLNNSNYCKRGGWFNEKCIKAEEKSFNGPNIPKKHNICFKFAICEVQPDGECGWTETSKFKNCMRKFTCY